MRQRKPDRIKHLFGLITIFTLLLLSGCAGANYWTWQHPGKQGELQLLKDQKECRNLAQSEVASINYYLNFYDMYPSLHYWPYYRDRHHSPMFNPYFRGYGHYRFLQQQDDLDRFYRICMKSRGWKRVKVQSDVKESSQ